MTIDEIKDTLQTWIKNADDEFDREEMGRVYGLKSSLRLIEKLDVPDTNAGDLISRQAVLREFTCLSDDAFVINSTIQNIVKKLPSVEPERKTGKWINVDGSTNTADCSCCGNRGRAWMNYCYECGSTMKGGVICNAED